MTEHQPVPLPKRHVQILGGQVVVTLDEGEAATLSGILELGTFTEGEPVLDALRNGGHDGLVALYSELLVALDGLEDERKRKG